MFDISKQISVARQNGPFTSIALAMILANIGLYFGSELYTLIYLSFLIGSSWYFISKYIAQAGDGAQAKIYVSIELNVLILSAALFYFFRSITPEVFAVTIGSTDQAYFVFCFSGYAFLYFGITGGKKLIRGDVAAFFRCVFGVIMLIQPFIYFLFLILER